MIGLIRTPPFPSVSRRMDDFSDAELDYLIRYEMQDIARQNETPYLKNLLAEARRREKAAPMPKFSAKEDQ